MAKRALLIGSQTGGLTGVHGDIRVMDEALEGLGFETNPIIEDDATFDGIISNYRALIDDTTSDDAAVIYYSGHGGRQRNDAHDADPTLPSWLQFLVPYDIDDRRGGTFRGLLAEELSLLQFELTQRSTNVTTILDCCHSSRMSRDPSMIPKADQRISPRWAAVRDRWTQLSGDLAAAGASVDANPHAVQIAACAPDESAYEMLDPQLGAAHGALTARLHSVLTSAQVPTMTWRDLIDLVRPAIMDVIPSQRPDVLGPNGDRFLFSLDERSSSGVLSVRVDEGLVVIESAGLLGLAEADQYVIVAPGGDPRQPLDTATVVRIASGRAQLALGTTDPAALPKGALAYPVSTAIGRRPVAVVPLNHPDRAQVVETLAGSPHVRIAQRPAELLATVELGDDDITLLDAAGAPLYQRPRPLTESGIADLDTDLRTLARATHVRELGSGTGPAELADEVEVTYARLTAGGEQPLAPSGEHLFIGDKVIVRVLNRASARRYVSTLDVGIAGEVTLLTYAQPSGTSLEAGEGYVVGSVPSGAIKGLELFWPDNVPDGSPRPETLITLVADAPVSGLVALGQSGVVSRSAGSPPSTSLEALLGDVRSGTRGFRVPTDGVVETRYRVHRFDFVFHPAPRQGDDSEPAFEIEERPSPTMRLVVPRGVDPPGRVAVRLTELVVHSNRALLAASVRIDAMVVTVPPEGTGDPYRAATARFDRIKDGDRLPFDNLLVYEGPVGRFVDLAVWVAKDDQKELDLAELLVTESVGNEVKGAVAVLAGLAVAAPQAALVAGSVAAVATLVRMGARLLDTATGRSIGVYRTSLLPHERFGAGPPSGRHPASGLLQAQDMSFAYEVIELTD